jgi:peptide/nickel transport system permease protein
MVVVVFLSTVAIYALLNLAPGGPLSGLNLIGDRQQRPSEGEILALEAFLGLDKPLALRYVSWVLGDDWIGADWVYLGASRFEYEKIGANGTPITRSDPQTGERTPVTEEARFWADPGPAYINPGYTLWVWGTDIGESDVMVTENRITEVRSLPTILAEQVQVNPKPNETRPDDIGLEVTVLSQEGPTVVVRDLNQNRYAIQMDSATAFIFPPGLALPRPDGGRWLNISGLTGSAGLLSRWAGFHGQSHGILRLDFGDSWSTKQPVIDMIDSRLGNTLTLMVTATILSLVIGIPIGVYSAVNQYSKADYAVTTFAFFGSAMPVFWFGLMMILLFSVGFKAWGLPFLPTGGVASLRPAAPDSLLGLLNVSPGSFIDRLTHLFMPVIVLSLLSLATWSRFARGSMLEVLRQDYVRTARAKGLMERAVVYKHAMRNALIPVVATVVFGIVNLFNGAILTETIFAYPGMGRLYFDALGRNDWPVVMSYLFISAILVVIATLVRDVLFSVIDPRIRFT